MSPKLVKDTRRGVVEWGTMEKMHIRREEWAGDKKTKRLFDKEWELGSKSSKPNKAA